jgi:hypothetical protein
MIAVTRFQKFLPGAGHQVRRAGSRFGLLTPAHFETKAGTGRPTRRCVAALVEACSTITGELVKASDLFDARASRRSRSAGKR